jgi:hypothetical protein
MNPMTCPRCDAELQYVGTKKFHEGTRPIAAESNSSWTASASITGLVDLRGSLILGP